MIPHSFRNLAAASVLAVASITAMASLSARADAVVAVVDGTEINESDIATAAAEFGTQLQQIPETQRRKVLIDVLVDMTILANAAKAEKLDETEEFRSRLAFLETRALRNEFFEKKITDSVTEEKVAARYEKDLEGYSGPEEVKARHILVETEEEAKSLIEELDGGADFAELAKEKSTGPSGPNGGDLGYFTRDRMVQPFADAAFEMETGAHSQTPVQTQFGWHVIKVEDKRSQPKPSLAEMSDQIRNTLVREQLAEVMDGLKSKAKIEIHEPAAE